MKKNYLLTKNTMAVIILLCCVFLPSLVYSQTEWLWAKSYYGTGNMNYETNEIIRAGFDSYGNVYIYGRLVGSTMFDGAPFLSGISSFYGHGSILAKIDPLGNVVWVRPVKGTGDMYLPLWMEIQNDQICVFGTVHFPTPYEGSTEKLYYFDTLVNYLDAVYIPEEERELPFHPDLKGMNYMTVFDMDGNIVKQNFLQLANQRHPGTSYLRFVNAPFHIDQNGNIYISTTIGTYRQNGNERNFDIIIDNEKRFNVSYPIECPGRTHNPYLLKFSSDFDLSWAKQLISHTTALIEENGESYIDTVQLLADYWSNKLTYDQDGDMYLIGKASLLRVLSADSVRACDGRIVSFPVNIYLDSVHHIHIKDCSANDRGLPFIIKFDTAGNILWVNQLYTSCDNPYQWTEIQDVVISKDDVFVSGFGQYNEAADCYTYFDREETILTATPHDGHRDITFIAKYDRISGEYITHIPIHGGGTQQIGIVNNHLALFGNVGSSVPNFHILKFRDDLTLMSIDTVLTTIPANGAFGGICAHESGYLFCYNHTYRKSGTFNFSPFVQATAALESSAVFALQYDPSLSIPYEYVGISEYDKAASISVYPNPVQHILYIGIDDPIIQFKEAELFSLTGQKIGKYTNQIIPVENLSSGLYLLRISTDKGSYVKKFTKN